MAIPTILVLPWLVIWVTLLRALLVRAAILPATCGRCGLRCERSRLGERICRCAHQ